MMPVGGKLLRMSRSARLAALTPKLSLQITAESWPETSTRRWRLVKRTGGLHSPRVAESYIAVTMIEPPKYPAYACQQTWRDFLPQLSLHRRSS